jgi:hypothetical protein
MITAPSTPTGRVWFPGGRARANCKCAALPCPEQAGTPAGKTWWSRSRLRAEDQQHWHRRYVTTQDRRAFPYQPIMMPAADNSCDALPKAAWWLGDGAVSRGGAGGAAHADAACVTWRGVDEDRSTVVHWPSMPRREALFYPLLVCVRPRLTLVLHFSKLQDISSSCCAPPSRVEQPQLAFRNSISGRHEERGGRYCASPRGRTCRSRRCIYGTLGIGGGQHRKLLLEYPDSKTGDPTS